MRFVVGGVLQLPLFAQQCCANYARLAHRSIYFDSNFDDDRSLGGWMDGWIDGERGGGKNGGQRGLIVCRGTQRAVCSIVQSFRPHSIHE